MKSLGKGVSGLASWDCRCDPAEDVQMKTKKRMMISGTKDVNNLVDGKEKLGAVTRQDDW